MIGFSNPMLRIEIYYDLLFAKNVAKPAFLNSVPISHDLIERQIRTHMVGGYLVPNDAIQKARSTFAQIAA